MELAPSGVSLSSREVDDLAARLSHLARVTTSSQLAALATEWVSHACSIAYLLSLEPEPFMMGAWEFAIRHQIPLRTVQYRCSKGHLPAMKDQTGRWRIRAA